MLMCAFILVCKYMIVKYMSEVYLMFSNHFPSVRQPFVRHLRSDYCFIKYSAICTAFSAAPFLIWSDTVQKVNPFSLAKSFRMRPTYTGSFPAKSSGIGYSFC